MTASVIAFFSSIYILVVYCNGFKIYNDHRSFDVKSNTDYKLIRNTFFTTEKRTRDVRCHLYLHGFEQHLLDHGLLSASVDIFQQARKM